MSLAILNSFCNLVKATPCSFGESCFIMFRQHYVTEGEELSGSPAHSVNYAGCWVCFLSACGGGQQAVCASTCLTVSTAWRSSSLILASQGHSSQWSDHQLCLFSPAALRDRCKCCPNLDALTDPIPAALHLFLTLALPLLLLSSPSSISSPPGLASLFLPALFFPPPLRSFRDVNKSDSGGRLNDRISLSAGSLVTLPSPFDFSCPPPHPTPPLLSPPAAAAT